MIFHAVSTTEYRSHPYAIHWGVQGWTVYNMGKRKACLGRNVTMSQAIAAAEQDAKDALQQPQG